jgi:hypothetical protein
VRRTYRAIPNVIAAATPTDINVIKKIILYVF